MIVGGCAILLLMTQLKQRYSPKSTARWRSPGTDLASSDKEKNKGGKQAHLPVQVIERSYLRPVD